MDVKFKLNTFCCAVSKEINLYNSFVRLQTVQSSSLVQFWAAASHMAIIPEGCSRMQSKVLSANQRPGSWGTALTLWHGCGGLDGKPEHNFVNLAKTGPGWAEGLGVS